MKQVIFAFIFSSLMAGGAHANTVMYKCLPSSDDGDSFGETIVMGFDYVGGFGPMKPLRLNLISDYLGSASSPIAAVAHAGPNDLFQAFSTLSGDPESTYSRGLMVNAEADKLENFAQTFNAEISTHGDLQGDNKVVYACDRISD